MNLAAFRRPSQPQPTGHERVWSLVQDLRQAEVLDANEARQALAEVAAAQSMLAALQCVLLGRLVASAVVPNALTPDENLSVTETARRTGMSSSYLYKNAAKLPFSVKIGARVLFSARGLERWQKQLTVNRS